MLAGGAGSGRRPLRLPGDSGGTVYNGRSGQVSARIPRINAEVPVDGTLTAPPWQRAAVLNGFSEYLPVNGVAGG